MTAIDDLLDSIFGDDRPALYAEFEVWVRESRRFKAFAASYRSKIRSKLNHAREDSRLQDLRAELATAALLLREERFTLEYETYASSKQRGPDFTVTFKTHTPFNVEVRRMPGVELDGADADPHTGKLIAVLCDKVGQMPPGIINLLWLAADQGFPAADLTRAALTLRQLAEQKTEDFFTRRGFESAATFLKQYRQLSGIVTRQAGEHAIWPNPLARHPVPPEIVTAIRRLEVG